MIAALLALILHLAPDPWPACLPCNPECEFAEGR